MSSHGISTKAALCIGFLTAGLLLALPVLARAQSPITPLGSGTEADPYLISELGHLVWMGENAVDSAGQYYTMTCDIDASDTANFNDEGTDTDLLEGFKPIGNYFSRPNETTSFRGIFDGQDHTITGLVINRPSTHDVGLFGATGMGGQIENLGIVDSTVTGYYMVGSLVGESHDGTITNCYATGNVNGVFSLGGLVGLSSNSTVSNCYTTSNVTGSNDMVGGLIGQCRGPVADCHATGSISGREHVGGLLGQSHGPISNCYATGMATGDRSVGGLIGYNIALPVSNCYATGVTASTYANCGGLIGYNTGSVTNCYATGAMLYAGSARGGLVGYNKYRTISHCYAIGAVARPSDGSDGGLVGENDPTGTVLDSYWDIETTGCSTSEGGTGKTTAEMMQQATFVDWDFIDIWGIVENETYPYLLSLHDSDGDGVTDDEDDCPDSDLSETIVINGYDTGVVNQGLDTGCTMADEIALLAESSANHGDFVRQVSYLTNAWKRDGLISGADKGRIQSAAAR